MSVEDLEQQFEEKKTELTFEERIKLKDKILEAKKNAGYKPVHHQISCMGCGS